MSEPLGQRERFGSVAHHFDQLLEREIKLCTELGQGGRALEFRFQDGLGVLKGGELVASVHRQADGAAGIGDTAGDGLADPPSRVGGELEALAPVELLYGMDESQVSFLGEVDQWQA